MTSIPNVSDAEQAITDARAHLEVAAGSQDEAVRNDRYRQAAVRLGYASRVLSGLAGQPSRPWGTGLQMPQSGSRGAGL